MNEEKINFKEQREFGEVLNMTFAFIRQNLGKLAKAIIYFCGPFILLQGIAMVFYNTNVGNLVSNLKIYGFNYFFENFFIYFLLFMVTTFLCFIMMISTDYSYIKLYIENGKDGFKIEDVWKSVTKNYLRLLGTAVICGFLVSIGSIMCFIPGIYLGVVFSLIIPIIIFEDKSFGEAFSRSFKLANYHWWWLLLLFIVIYAIIYIVSLIFSIPQAILGITYQMHSLNTSLDIPEYIKYVLAIITIITTFVTTMLTVIIYVAISFEYFNIVEKKESPSLLNKIEEMENNQI